MYVTSYWVTTGSNDPQTNSSFPSLSQLDSEGRVTIVHKDIKPSQFVQMSGGRYQLSDFNVCMFPSWDPKKNDYCNADKVKQLAEADVTKLGQLFNFMLRGKRPYDDPTTVTSPINSTHPLDVYVNRAMKMCLREDPFSEKNVARLLQAGYAKFGERKEKAEAWTKPLKSTKRRRRNIRAAKA